VTAYPERNIVAADIQWSSIATNPCYVVLGSYGRILAMNEFITIPELSSLSVFLNHPEIQELAGFLDVSSIPGIRVRLLPMHWHQHMV